MKVAELAGGMFGVSSAPADTFNPEEQVLENVGPLGEHKYSVALLLKDFDSGLIALEEKDGLDPEDHQAHVLGTSLAPACALVPYTPTAVPDPLVPSSSSPKPQPTGKSGSLPLLGFMLLSPAEV